MGDSTNLPNSSANNSKFSYKEQHCNVYVKVQKTYSLAGFELDIYLFIFARFSSLSLSLFLTLTVSFMSSLYFQVSDIYLFI
jgi:hypothetical protein